MEKTDWKPNKQIRIPIYKQIVEYIVHKIACGDWVVGDSLPTQRKLAEEFGVNRSTIVEAMEELKAMGLVRGFHTQGTKIINNTWSSLLSMRSLNWNQYINSSIHERNLPAVQTINKLEFEDDIIRLGTGELSPDLFPRDMFAQILKRLPEKIISLNYLEPKGLPQLRTILSGYLKTIGIDAPASGILIVSGALQALQLISVGILQQGSKVYVETPSYLKSLQIFQSSGMELQGIEMDREGLVPWLMNMPQQDPVGKGLAGKEKTKILYTIPTFHNPTGVTMSDKRRDELINWCKVRQLPIIEDDCYRELWLDQEPPLSLKARDENGMVLYLGSVSKSLAPGLRLGWLVGPESIIEHLSDIKMQMDYGASSVSQWILAEWIESGMYSEHVKQLRSRLRERRNLTLKLLQEYLGELATWQVPEGGFYIWLKCNQKISTEKLFQDALNRKVLINPGSIYDFKRNDYIRLSYSYADEEQLKKGISILASLIKEY